MQNGKTVLRVGWWRRSTREIIETRCQETAVPLEESV